jgi:hypothetical protein
VFFPKPPLKIQLIKSISGANTMAVIPYFPKPRPEKCNRANIRGPENKKAVNKKSLFNGLFFNALKDFIAGKNKRMTYVHP